MKPEKKLFSGELTEKRSFLILLALTLSLTWTAMSPCLRNGFVNWDETRSIIENPRIKTLSLDSVKTIFSEPDLNMYSPLSTLSYALNYHIGGLDPRVFHATNLLLHLANTALVMFLTRILLQSVWLAFFTALLFGIHPAHVESVAWAAERKDMLYAFFYLAALTAYGSGRRGIKTYSLSFALFICALLSKPMAITLPLALLLMDYLKPEGVRLQHWLYKTPFFAAAAVFVFLLLSTPGNVTHAHWATRIVTPLYNLGFYIYTLLWPFDLSAMYVLPPGGKPAAYMFAAGAVAGMGLLWTRFRRDKVVVFGAAFFAVMLLPVLQFIPFGPVISADRYTYMSSIGIFIIGTVYARRIWRGLGHAGRQAGVVAAVCVVLVLSTASRTRCAVWKDGVSLWSDTLRKQPEALLAFVNLCGAYIQAGMTADAESCLSLAIRKYPGNDDNYYNLGFLYAQIREFAKAEKCFAMTLDITPCHAAALNNMGNLRLIKGDAAGAADYYARAVKCDGEYAAAYSNLAKLALLRGDTAAAAQFYKKEHAVSPGAKPRHNPAP